MRWTLLVPALSLAACASAGQVQEASRVVLIGMYASEVVGRYTDYLHANSDQTNAEQLAEEALFALATIDPGDAGSVTESLRSAFEAITSYHDAFVRTDPSLTEPERAAALRVSARLMFLIEAELAAHAAPPTTTTARLPTAHLDVT